MALEKAITRPNGIVLTYHRVSLFRVVTNELITINLKSYLSKEERDKELLYLQSKDLRFELMAKDPAELTMEEQLFLESPEEPCFVYQENTSFTAPYSEHMSVTSAYEYLKTLPEFEGSLDV